MNVGPLSVGFGVCQHPNLDRAITMAVRDPATGTDVDFENDGILNLMEFVLNGHPEVSDTTLFIRLVAAAVPRG